MIREVQLRFADVIVCGGRATTARVLLSELDAVRGPRHAAHGGECAVRSSGPAAASTGRGRCGARFPQIGLDDPVVLWWGKVWKWFDASTALRAFALVVGAAPTLAW